MIEASTDRGALDVVSTRVVEAHSFVLGNLVVLTPTGWQLADKNDRDKAADGVIVAADVGEFRIITFGTVFRWPSHGLGTAAQMLWLGNAGGYETTMPLGAGVRAQQKIGKVLDVNHILIFPYEPFLIGP